MISNAFNAMSYAGHNALKVLIFLLLGVENQAAGMF